MVSEIDCITNCILQPFNPLNFYANILLGSIILLTTLLLLSGRLTIKPLLLVKSILLLAIFGLLLNWFLIRPSFDTIFATLHNSILLLILLFFISSYFFSSTILGFGLKKKPTSNKITTLFEKTQKEANLKSITILIFNDPQKIAFAVAGFKPTIFISTAVCESFSPQELKYILQHELLHFKSPFFSFKRILHSIKAGFFGLIPISLDDFDDYEEEKLDTLLERRGTSIRSIRKKMD